MALSSQWRLWWLECPLFSASTEVLTSLLGTGGPEAHPFQAGAFQTPAHRGGSRMWAMKALSGCQWFTIGLSPLNWLDKLPIFDAVRPCLCFLEGSVSNWPKRELSVISCLTVIRIAAVFQRSSPGPEDVAAPLYPDMSLVKVSQSELGFGKEGVWLCGVCPRRWKTYNSDVSNFLGTFLLRKSVTPSKIFPMF